MAPSVNKGILTICYTLFIFFVTIGLFNIISAIFVDSTLAYAAKLEKQNLNERLEDENRFAVNVMTVIGAFMKVENAHTFPELTLDSFDGIKDLEFTGAKIEEVTNDELVTQALDNLDIDRKDHKRLLDILDPDRDGFISIIDLVTGLMRLRGEARRSDIVCCDLMIRSLNKAVQRIEAKVTALVEIEPTIVRPRTSL